MRKHFIITLILLFALSLSACNKAETSTETSSNLPTQDAEIIEETSTETSSNLPTQDAEIIEETSTKITPSEPVTTEKSTTQVIVSKEEKRKNISTTTTTLPQMIEVKPTQKPKSPENKTTIKNVP